MTGRRVTATPAGLTVLVLALSLPGALRDALDRGGFPFRLAALDRDPAREENTP
jgi:hypothetical protein